MSEIQPYRDGDTYPVLRLTLENGALPRDLTNCAVEFYIMDKEGALLCIRAGKIIYPASNGQVECFFLGRETDFDGAGGERIVMPVVYAPFTDANVEATNLLLNPTLDNVTGSSPTQFPTSWTVVGTPGSGESYAGGTGTSQPPPYIISENSGSPTGKYWSITTGSAPATRLEQTVSLTPANGSWLSAGVWVRSYTVGQAPAAASDSAALKIDCTGGVSADDVLTQFAAPSSDWRFVIAERRLRSSNITAAIVSLNYLGQPATTWHFDDAGLFNGQYRRYFMKKMTLPVLPRLRRSKTQNLLAGVGGFERDSNGDGLPDGWVVSSVGSADVTVDGTYTRAGVSYVIEKDPDFIRTGRSAMDVTFNSALTNACISTQVRGRFLSGETYEFSGWVRQSVSPSSAPGIQLVQEPFQTTGREEMAASTTITGLSGTYQKYSVQLVLTADIDCLECRFWWSGITSGQVRVDDCELKRV